jgi:hypothetical protein
MSLSSNCSGWNFVRDVDGIRILKEIQEKAGKNRNDFQSQMVNITGWG